MSATFEVEESERRTTADLVSAADTGSEDPTETPIEKQERLQREATERMEAKKLALVPQPAPKWAKPTKYVPTGVSGLAAQQGDARAVALIAAEMGLSVCPPVEDGNKAPDSATWKQYQYHASTPDEVEDRWYADGDRSGVGVFLGEVSGHLEMTEIEGRAFGEGAMDSLLTTAHEWGPEAVAVFEKITTGCSDESPSTGIHFYTRCPDGEVKNQKLARCMKWHVQKQEMVPKCLAEAKGEAGYTIIAGSHGPVHKSGRPWKPLSGSLETIPTITADEQKIWHDLLRTLDRMPETEVFEPSGKKHDPKDMSKPGNAYNVRATWDDVLVGWTHFSDSAGRALWWKPGKHSGAPTAGIDDTDRMRVWGEVAELEAEKSYDKWAAYTFLNHGGDFKASTKALRAQGYGQRSLGKGETPTAATVFGHSATVVPINPDAESEEDEGESALSKLLLPDEFWEARPVFGQIRQAAHSRAVSGDVAFHGVLVRLSAMVDHRIKIPAIRGTRAPLNYCAVATGGPETGKSSSYGVSEELLPTQNDLMEIPVGSGEGFVESLFDDVSEVGDDGKTRTTKRQTRFNLVAFVDEGESATTLGARSGSTLFPTVRTLWSGGQVGQANANKDRRRIVPKGQYSFGMMMAIQSKLAGPLLADSAAGTPQRFAWVESVNPNVPDVAPLWTGPIDWTPPTSGGTSVRSAGFATIEMVVDSTITAEVFGRGVAKQRGVLTVEIMEAHADLLRLKIAGLLAVLDSRLNMTPEDWHLAGIVIDTSRAVRKNVQAIVKDAEAFKEEATSERLARRQVKGVNAVEASQEEKCALRILQIVVKAGGEQTYSKVRRLLGEKQRDVHLAAIALAVEEGWLEEVSGDGQGTDKHLLRVPKMEPE
jgi:hypothetical protein